MHRRKVFCRIPEPKVSCRAIDCLPPAFESSHRPKPAYPAVNLKADSSPHHVQRRSPEDHFARSKPILSRAAEWPVLRERPVNRGLVDFRILARRLHWLRSSAQTTALELIRSTPVGLR